MCIRDSLKAVIKVLHPVSLKPPGVALTPERLPKHHPSRQALFARACNDASALHPLSANRRLSDFRFCPEKGAGLENDVVYDRRFSPMHATTAVIFYLRF